MKILSRSTKSEKWNTAASIKTKGEVELQNLLVESPSLIPVDEIREGTSPPVVAVPEFGLPGSGYTDILSFSKNGDIAIIECKLAANSESKRKVIGQIIEYAAYLWGMSYEEVNDRIQRLKGESLSDLVTKAVKGEWDEEVFRNGVKESLERGSFILVIVVDEINEELKHIIRYINECTKSAFSLHALEMRRFKGSGVEILVPHLYGISSKPTGREKKKWTEVEFFKVFDENVEPETGNIVRELYEWAKNSNLVDFGSGRKMGTFHFQCIVEGKSANIFTIDTNGKLWLNYGDLSKK